MKVKNKYFILLSLVLVPSFLFSQWKIAISSEDGRIQTHEITTPPTGMHKDPSRTSEILLIPGFPKILPADPSFKNFRNLTLADLDQDGMDEIISGIGDQIYVFKKDSLLWSHRLSCIARFPAAAGDIDQDGYPEIILLTGYNEQPGKIYLFQHDGKLAQPWPIDFNGRWLLSSPALADLNKDGFLEIIFGDRDGIQGNVYILNRDGTPFNEGWPVSLDNVAATTPSIGDIDADGIMEIVICSTREAFVFDLNGQLAPGWPQSRPGTKFSFQSQIIVDLDNDGTLEIVGAGHGDQPIYYVFDHHGNDLPGWPKPVPGKSWTFNPPTVIIHQDVYSILNARPLGNDLPADMLYNWTPEGDIQNGFPIVKTGGTEGVLTVGDINNDQIPDILFPSNFLNPKGQGFIHAYPLIGGDELPGFPLLVPGFTFLNGATLGEIDGDGKMDMVVLSYTENAGSIPDTAFIHAFTLPSPYRKDQIEWPTYKGNNIRNGLVSPTIVTAVRQVDLESSWHVYPNPVNTDLKLDLTSFPQKTRIGIRVQTMDGKVNYSRTGLAGQTFHSIDVNHLPPGVYFLSVTSSWATSSKKIVIVR
jgi:hypothetical protein